MPDKVVLLLLYICRLVVEVVLCLLTHLDAVQCIAYACRRTSWAIMRILGPCLALPMYIDLPNSVEIVWILGREGFQGAVLCCTLPYGFSEAETGAEGTTDLYYAGRTRDDGC